MSYKDKEVEVVYIGNADGCRVETINGTFDVKRGELIKLKGIQLTHALSHGWIEKEIYDEEYNQ